MGYVRAFTREDIAEIVALRRRIFSRTERPADADLAAYIEGVFFDNPWRDETLPSLVYADASGRPIGFLGVVPRPAIFQGEHIRVAVCTQLMADPDARELIGIQLARTFLAGEQDLSLADVANHAGRAIWEGFGGSVSFTRNLMWTLPLRPYRYYSNALGPPALALAARPLCALLDALLARRYNGGSLYPEPLTPQLMAASSEEVLADAALRPVYDEAPVTWLLNHLGAKRTMGSLRQVALRDPHGTLAGWFIYFTGAQGVGSVVQVAARAPQRDRVFAHLLHDASAHQLMALTGRVEPELWSTLNAAGAFFTRNDPSALIHSKQAALVSVAQGNKAFLSRLEGEWWMSF